MPNNAKMIAAIFLSALGGIIKLCTKKFRVSPSVANVKTKPSVINSGLDLLTCPTDVPNRIGRGRIMHGAAMVRMPAMTARAISSMVLCRP
jgi:hypothetical protein